MVMYANEFKTKEKQKLTEIKNKLQHNYTSTWKSYTIVNSIEIVNLWPSTFPCHFLLILLLLKLQISHLCYPKFQWQFLLILSVQEVRMPFLGIQKVLCLQWCILSSKVFNVDCCIVTDLPDPWPCFPDVTRCVAKTMWEPQWILWNLNGREGSLFRWEINLK